MRPFVHPSIHDITVEGILHALADPVRASIFADIVGQECVQSCTMAAKLGQHAIPKSTLSQHFRILREAGLIRSERHGVEMRNTSRAGEIEERFPGLLTGIVHAYTAQEAGQRKKGTPKRPLP